MTASITTTEAGKRRLPAIRVTPGQTFARPGQCACPRARKAYSVCPVMCKDVVVLQLIVDVFVARTHRGPAGKPSSTDVVLHDRPLTDVQHFCYRSTQPIRLVGPHGSIRKGHATRGTRERVLFHHAISFGAACLQPLVLVNAWYSFFFSFASLCSL